MEVILQQIGALLLGSVPTLVLFVVLVICYQLLVQGPLSRTLRERRARTSGAVEEAHRAISAAEARTADYAEKLRIARGEVFRVREQRLKQWAQERDAQLDQVRAAANKQVQDAKKGLNSEAATARQTLEAGADQLAEQVIRAVLPVGAGGSL